MSLSVVMMLSYLRIIEPFLYRIARAGKKYVCEWAESGVDKPFLFLANWSGLVEAGSI